MALGGPTPMDTTGQPESKIRWARPRNGDQLVSLLPCQGAPVGRAKVLSQEVDCTDCTTQKLRSQRSK